MTKTMIKDAKTVKSIAKKIYGNEATLCEGRWFSKCENGKGSTWMYCFLEFAKKDYPDECPDVARMAAFIEACKKALGDDCPQAKATVYYNKGSETYSLIWEQFVYDN